MTLHRTISSPAGNLTLLSRDGHRLSGLYTVGHKLPPDLGSTDDTILEEAVAQLDQYFAGTRQEFSLDLDLRGSAFELRVWAALKEIPYGETTTYGALAVGLGHEISASRAVGVANARNPVSVIVPCHRVIGADGSLTGYAGGLAMKRQLLEHEASHATGGGPRQASLAI